LLEMGHKFATKNAAEDKADASTVPFMPDAMELSSSLSVLHGPLISARTPPPIGMNVRHFRRHVGSSFPSDASQRNTSHGRHKTDNHHDHHAKHADYLSMLQQFQNCCALVKSGEISELQAGRSLLAHAPLLETTRAALIRSCTFQNDTYATRSFMRPYGCADGHGNTPLHWAAFKNETECVRLLLQYNADPNARAHPSGWTPLHDAAYSNSSQCIELLVSKGAHVDARANSGATPLCFAAQEDAADAAQFLLNRGADLSARCAGAQQDDAMQQPFQLPNHPHSRFSGYTPLHYCAHYNAQRASRVLLAHPKARIAMETPDLSGRLPIHVAVARGSSDVLRALLHAGARVDIRPNNSPKTPSSMPAHFGQFPDMPATRRPPLPEEPETPNRSRSLSSSTSSSPVTSPVLRSMIPSQPISSSKPWNCLSQQAIDECKELISKAEQCWTPEHHLLFTPQDRKAVMELLRVGKRLEQNGTGIFIDLWPQVLGFCGRGWFETEDMKCLAVDSRGQCEEESDGVGDESDTEGSVTTDDDDDYLALPSFR
jgi:ankyrin repeat protein